MLENPLHNAIVVQHVDNRNEKDGGGQLGLSVPCQVNTAGVTGKKKTDRTVLMKNQCNLMVFWSKKKTAPASDSLRISAARVAIQLNMENPARVLKTNKAIACCRKRPTITVGLVLNQRVSFCERPGERFQFTKVFQPDCGRQCRIRVGKRRDQEH